MRPGTASITRFHFGVVIAPHLADWAIRRARSLLARYARAIASPVEVEQGDAEAASVSLPTIKRLEANDGPMGCRSGTGVKIQTALEAAGVVFIEENGGGAGVRLRKCAKTKISDVSGLNAPLRSRDENGRRGNKSIRAPAGFCRITETA
jgi:hypothetical protein